MPRSIFLLVAATFALPALAFAPGSAFAAPAQTPTAPTPAPPIQRVPEVTQIFPDVPEDHWAAAAVSTLAKAGLVEGDPKGHFRGNDPITRYEFAVVIARLAFTRTICFPLEPPQPSPISPSAPTTVDRSNTAETRG